ncbi:O-antigen polysaccharide polymerase Wzy family protein [Peribacillus frigoritolerans]|nr:O-antigen polysaccharide polymerase Wzy family protein [Peribacillus frigoritolerans]
MVNFRNKLRKSSSTNVERYAVYLFISILGYIAYIFMTFVINNNSEFKNTIFVLSWLGILLGVFVIISWKRITGIYFSPYTIFMVFFFLFNYGQCLMWAFGIHVPNEIGQVVLYPHWGVPTSYDIVKTQLLTLICLLMFHCGAVLCYKGKIKRQSGLLDKKQKYIIEDNLSLRIMFNVCFIFSIIVFPITLYYAFVDLQIAQTHGYRALYYSEYARRGGSLLILLSKLFFPCIVGMLIGSKFNKKIRIYVYSVFLLYLVLNLLAGDRGSWIYTLVILIWLSHFCYKPINFKRFVFYALVCFVSIYIIDVIVSLRNVGITYDNVVNTISLDNSPIVETIFEMGSSMSPAILLQKYDWDIWPYSNTYFLAILTMVTNKTVYLLDIPFATIGSWFSQTYLGISYGAGFSIVAEALLNFGPYLAPFVLFILGYFISTMIYIDKNNDYKNRPLRVFFAVATLECIIPLTRNYLHYQLKDWLYGVLILSFTIYIIKRFISKKRHYKY